MELPDKKLNTRLNFGCGAILGFVIGFIGVMSSGAELAESAMAGFAFALGLAVLTVLFGDRVLEWALRLFVP